MTDRDSSAARGAGLGGRPRDPALDDAIIEATRRRLVSDGYANMTIGDIAADAGVTRPTIYRRWPGKLELVVDALDHGFRAQRETYPDVDLDALPPRAAFTEAVRRLDPGYYNADAMVLMGNFMGEALRTPELIAVLRRHGVEPRVDLVEGVLRGLQDRGEVRPGIDVGTIATLCFGSYFADYFRSGGSGGSGASRGEGGQGEGLAERVVAVLWPAISPV